MDRDLILQEILNERNRQCDLPGVEFDIKNSPNDWAAIVSSYALRNLNHKNLKPDYEEFKQDMVSAAAVIVAAVEHLENMKAKNFFK